MDSNINRAISEENLIQLSMTNETISFLKKRGMINVPLSEIQSIEDYPNGIGMSFLRDVYNIVYDYKFDIVSWETNEQNVSWETYKRKWYNVYHGDSGKVKKRISIYLKNEQVIDASVTTYTKDGDLDTSYSACGFMQFR